MLDSAVVHLLLLRAELLGVGNLVLPQRPRILWVLDSAFDGSLSCLRVVFVRETSFVLNCGIWISVSSATSVNLSGWPLRSFHFLLDSVVNYRIGLLVSDATADSTSLTSMGSLKLLLLVHSLIRRPPARLVKSFLVRLVLLVDWVLPSSPAGVGSSAQAFLVKWIIQVLDNWTSLLKTLPTRLVGSAVRRSQILCPVSRSITSSTGSCLWSTLSSGLTSPLPSLAAVSCFDLLLNSIDNCISWYGFFEEAILVIGVSRLSRYDRWLGHIDICVGYLLISKWLWAKAWRIYFLHPFDGIAHSLVYWSVHVLFIQTLVVVVDGAEVFAAVFYEIVLAVFVSVCWPIVELVLVFLVLLLNRIVGDRSLVREIGLSSRTLDYALAGVLRNLNRAASHPWDNLLSSILEIDDLGWGLASSLADCYNILIFTFLTDLLPVWVLWFLNSQFQQASFIRACPSSLRVSTDRPAGFVIRAFPHGLVGHLWVCALGRVDSTRDRSMRGVLIVSEIKLMENII